MFLELHTEVASRRQDPARKDTAVSARVGQGEELLSELLVISKMLPLFFQGPSFCIKVAVYTASFRGITLGEHVSTKRISALPVSCVCRGLMATAP